MSYITNLESYQKDSLRTYLLKDFEAFSKFVFKIQTGQEFLTVDYHAVMFKAINMLITGESKRMIINIPPRAGKTQLISIFLPLFAWCHNPHAHNILTGFNSSVLAECTGYIRTIMTDPDFKAIFPDVVLDFNKKSVEKMGTMSGGVTNAIVTGGAMTGLGAGQITKDKSFAGVFIIDDALKSSVANSPAERDKINDRYTNTMISRLATEETPLVVISQRLHSTDLPGFLMTGGSPDHFDWLNVSGILTRESGSPEWYQKQIDDFGYTNVKPIIYDLERTDAEFDELGESSFWPLRKSLETLQALREVDPYTYYTQYGQIPFSKGTSTINYEDLRTHDSVDPSQVAYTFLTADTASTTETYSDYSVACFWAVMKNADLYLVDLIVDKYKTPELVVAMRDFWRKHNKFDIHAPNMLPRYFAIENKASGMFLNQQYLKDGTVTVKEVPRDGNKNNDKFSRFLNAVPYFKQGRVSLPRGHEHEGHIKRELVGQTELGNQTGHDDFVDNVSDAVVMAYSVQTINYADWM